MLQSGKYGELFCHILSTADMLYLIYTPLLSFAPIQKYIQITRHISPFEQQIMVPWLKTFPKRVRYVGLINIAIDIVHYLFDVLLPS